MEAVRSFEILVNFYRTTLLYIREACTLHSHRYVNLNSKNIKMVPREDVNLG
jgi:hypothetical protein